MPAITIRGVPQDVRDRLAARAAASGQSLQEYLLAELTALGARPSMMDLVAGIRARKAVGLPSIDTAEIVRLIRDDRDSR